MMDIIKKNIGDQRIWLICIIVFKYTPNSSICRRDYGKEDGKRKILEKGKYSENGGLTDTVFQLMWISEDPQQFCGPPVNQELVISNNKSNFGSSLSHNWVKWVKESSCSYFSNCQRYNWSADTYPHGLCHLGSKVHCGKLALPSKIYSMLHHSEATGLLKW